MKSLAAAESKPITADALATEVPWTTSPEALRGRPVQLEFKLRDAALFGFEFEPTRS